MLETPSFQSPECKKCKLCNTLKPRQASRSQEVLTNQYRQDNEDDEDGDEDADKDGDSSGAETKLRKATDESDSSLDNPFAEPVWFDNGKLTLGLPTTVRDDYILVIGEAPGRSYEDTGDYNQWKTFQKLVRIWERLYLLDRILFIPVVRCYAPHEFGRPKVSVNQLRYCFSFNIPIIRQIKPKAIFALGFDACRSLTKRGDDFNLTGRVYRWSDPLDASTSFPVIPLWGLAYVNRDEKRYGKLYLEHWERAVDLISSTDLSKTNTQAEYTVATDVEEIHEWFDGLGSSDIPIGFDVETTSLKPKGVWDADFYITITSFSHPDRPKPLIVPFRYGFKLIESSPNRVWSLPDNSLISKLLEERGMSKTTWPARVQQLEGCVLAYLADVTIKKIGHNIKFDSLAIYRCYGVEVRGVVHDTMLMSYGLNPDAKRLNGLDDLIRKYVPEKADYHTEIDYFFTTHPDAANEYAQIPMEILFPYAADDTKQLHRLVERLEADMEKVDAKLDKNTFVFCGGEHQTYPLADYIFIVRRQHLLLTTEIEMNGVHIDKEALKNCTSTYEKLLDEYSNELNNNTDVVNFQIDGNTGLIALRDHRVRTKAEKTFITKYGLDATPEDKESYVQKALANAKDIQLNWKSVDHVRQLLYAYLGRNKVYTTQKGAPSTAEEALVHFATYDNCPVSKLLLKFREMSKFVDGFLHKLTTDDTDANFISSVDNRIHPSFGIDSTGTSRLTSCVDGSTRIDLAVSTKKIDEVCIGDYVRTHTGSLKKVLDVFTKGYSEMFEVLLENGNRITCTEQHRFLTPSGWRRLSELCCGSEVLTVRDGTLDTCQPHNRRLQTESIVEEGRWGIPHTSRTDTFEGLREGSLLTKSRNTSDTDSNKTTARYPESCLHAVGKIKSITSVGVRLVWDIHVDTDNSYTAQGFINHNSRPNIQQIPSGGHIKRVYGSRYKDGWILQRDYSGLEVRILALLSGDTGLREAFLNNEDVHFRTQRFFFGDRADKHNKPQRTVCKNALFGRVYGQGDNGLFEILTKNRVMSPDTGEPISFEECQKFNQLIDQSYPGVAKWIRDAQRHARRTGFAHSAFGFLRPMEVLGSYYQWEKLKAADYAEGVRSATTEILGREISAAMRKSQNTPIQSTAADLTVIAAQTVVRRLKKMIPEAKVCNLVHDSIWTDVPDDIKTAARTMWVKKDTMDRMDYWLPKVLPGYDASWIDIPIIGESEIGINAKDTFIVYREPEFDGDTFYIKVGKDCEYLYDKVDGEIRDGGAFKIVDFVKNVEEIQEFLKFKKTSY